MKEETEKEFIERTLDEKIGMDLQEFHSGTEEEEGT